MSLPQLGSSRLPGHLAGMNNHVRSAMMGVRNRRRRANNGNGLTISVEVEIVVCRRRTRHGSYSVSERELQVCCS